MTLTPLLSIFGAQTSPLPSGLTQLIAVRCIVLFDSSIFCNRLENKYRPLPRPPPSVVMAG